MGSCPTCLTDPSALLVADASTVINLNATGCAPRLLKALPNRMVVVDVVQEELGQGRQRQRQDADLLAELVKAKLVEIVNLDDQGERYFEQLVVGDAKDTLDDGEAATIAYAGSLKGIALIDETKAMRVCADRFPGWRLACTVDIFSHPDVRVALGNDGLSDAVFNALNHGRMRVFPQYVEWVVKLIGLDRAELCKSLPKLARRGNRAEATGASGQ
jgi:predicted nucleic acid-binding protein